MFGARETRTAGIRIVRGGVAVQKLELVHVVRGLMLLVMSSF